MSKPQRKPPDPSQPAPPPGWGADALTNYLDTARRNQWATFAKKREITEKLITIDAQFMEICKDWLNPESEITAYLLFCCFASYRAAAGLAMGTQVVDCFPQSRAMLEYAAYAAHIYRNPALAEVWLRRHDDAKSMSVQKRAFQHDKVAVSVTAANRHAGQRFEELYQKTIDFGGHPNTMAVLGNMQMTEEHGRRNMRALMQHGDGLFVEFGLKNVARCGLVSLEMLQIVFNARFELLGVNAEMLKLRKGL